MRNESGYRLNEERLGSAEQKQRQNAVIMKSFQGRSCSKNKKGIHFFLDSYSTLAPLLGPELGVFHAPVTNFPLSTQSAQTDPACLS